VEALTPAQIVVEPIAPLIMARPTEILAGAKERVGCTKSVLH